MPKLTDAERKEKILQEIEKRKLELKKIAKNERAAKRKLRAHRLCECFGKIDYRLPVHVEDMTEEEYSLFLTNLDIYVARYAKALSLLAQFYHKD